VWVHFKMKRQRRVSRGVGEESWLYGGTSSRQDIYSRLLSADIARVPHGLIHFES
jgi:hypothetical protein